MKCNNTEYLNGNVWILGGYESKLILRKPGHPHSEGGRNVQRENNGSSNNKKNKTNRSLTSPSPPFAFTYHSASFLPINPKNKNALKAHAFSLSGTSYPECFCKSYTNPSI